MATRASATTRTIQRALPFGGASRLSSAAKKALDEDEPLLDEWLGQQR